jgi:hypothetical protein
MVNSLHKISTYMPVPIMIGIGTAILWTGNPELVLRYTLEGCALLLPFPVLALLILLGWYWKLNPNRWKDSGEVWLASLDKLNRRTAWPEDVLMVMDRTLCKVVLIHRALAKLARSLPPEDRHGFIVGFDAYTSCRIKLLSFHRPSRAETEWAIEAWTVRFRQEGKAHYDAQKEYVEEILQTLNRREAYFANATRNGAWRHAVAMGRLVHSKLLEKGSSI